MTSGGEGLVEGGVGEPSVPLRFIVGFLAETDENIANRVDDLETTRPDIFADVPTVDRAIAVTAYQAGRLRTLTDLANALMTAGYLPDSSGVSKTS